ncbi:hypothetical protein AHAT_09930 [Agarivorans sp. Toyoura001]|uniref:DUF4365 domain-containing protein n=1 Tax=Agarivorans sp. Toyoura001 TaxID=2283141 RepID=UPI0010E30BD1|nr:DUF4365 domain-containing protein [Agarivorans sp. Toyoura001]GDY25103.1 hypothetical protein AHAT_09930 [Agarivorans sp. Toyoura001]
MNAGEIGKEAGRIFEYKLPSNWIARSQEDQDDHGIDYEIEIKNSDGKALGKDSVFKVQVKGEENCSFINDGGTVSHSIKVDRLKYYLSFNIPVILVVVDVTLERVFWVSVTDSDKIKDQVLDTEDASKSVHLPVENELIRRNEASFNSLLGAVTQCWDYLSLRGVKQAVENYTVIKSDKIDDIISDVGDALFKAYHAKLDQLLVNRNYPELYQQASQIFGSPLVPAKDRFIAVMYYSQAFSVSPYTDLKHEEVRERLALREMLVRIAREKRNKIYRLTSIGMARIELFRTQLDHLHALHISNQHFDSESFEFYYLNSETNKLYLDVCITLQKLIFLCNRLVRQGQLDVLAGLFVELGSLVLLFKTVHNARASEESIEFLERWFEQILLLTLIYVSNNEDYYKVERLYFMFAHMGLTDKEKQAHARKVTLDALPDSKDLLDFIDSRVEEMNEQQDFYELSVQEQKKFFIDMAKNLGMDPDDPENEFGRFVKMGLENYDPGEIVKTCEHIFVHYKPAGMIAQQLRMHSLGGGLIICLKHGHASGTGGSLAESYSRPNAPEPLQGFKQRHCDSCNDCSTRNESWKWSLKWQSEEVTKHQELLERFKFF